MVIREAANVAQKVKESLPDVTTVLGGPHISAVPEETFQKYPIFDIGVIGEGENTALELFTSDLSPEKLQSIDGLLLKKGKNIFRTNPRALIENLDSLPFPAYHLLPDLKKFYQHVVVRVDRMPSASVLISRGCTKGKCTFCSRDVYGGRSRIHSPEYAVALFESLIRDYGIRSLNFEDEDLLAFKPVMRKICGLILEKKIDLTWAVSGRVDMVNIASNLAIQFWSITPFCGIMSRNERTLSSITVPP